MTRVLENNLKPAECFIEVYSNGFKSYMLPAPSKIDELEHDLEYTRSLMPTLYTIAIFKIRMKPQ